MLTASNNRLNEAARNIPSDTLDATARLLRVVGKHQEHADFVTRVLHALASVTDVAELEQVESASSDYDALIELLNQPEFLDILRKRDPLTPARLRGFQLRERLLQAEGGTRSAAELAQMLRITRQAVDKRRKKGALIGLDLGRRGYAYPIWQIGLEGLDKVLAELQTYDPWTQVAFMLAPNAWLDGQTPLAMLRQGALDRVLDAARAYGEQIAV